MRPRALAAALAGLILALVEAAHAGQAPGAASAPDIPISPKDRVYLSDQSSNTVSVVNPEANSLLGVIRLGEPTPGNLSPLYTGQLLVHGMGFSPDHRTLVVVSVGSNSATFIDTQTNRVKHVTYLGRSPHEAMFTTDGREVWVTVRGENYVQVLDGKTYAPKLRITVPNGPGMTIFSPDGKYGYVCSSFTPETVVVDVHSHRIVGRVPQASPFCPDIAATPDGKQVWFTLKDIGKTEVFNARPPFNKIALLETGPITNHVNIVRNAQGQFAYVTVGGLNEVKVFTTSDDPQLVAAIPTGALPHGLWPSGDGTRIYIGLENADAVVAIDTLTNKVIATIPSGQSPQGMAYIPDAVPSGSGTENLSSLGDFAQAVHLTLGAPGSAKELTTVAVNDQGLVDLLEAAVTGLEPKSEYVLALAQNADGSGALEAIAQFKTNPSGAAIVTTIGPLRRAVQQDAHESRRYLVIAQAVGGKLGVPAQVQQ
ncbi:MAG TPA: YncE family protein [Casimicrobiaceae bacterium]|nr:YncE family protein [Casimicrobiaceae bacterium]